MTVHVPTPLESAAKLTEGALRQSGSASETLNSVEPGLVHDALYALADGLSNAASALAILVEQSSPSESSPSELELIDKLWAIIEAPYVVDPDVGENFQSQEASRYRQIAKLVYRQLNP